MALLEGRKRGRPRKDSVMDTLAVRLPDDIVSRIDQYVADLRERFPGLNVSRADAVRQLLLAGLDVEDEKLKAAKKD